MCLMEKSRKRERESKLSCLRKRRESSYLRKERERVGEREDSLKPPAAYVQSVCSMMQEKKRVEQLFNNLHLESSMRSRMKKTNKMIKGRKSDFFISVLLKHFFLLSEKMW